MPDIHHYQRIELLKELQTEFKDDFKKWNA